MFLEPNFSATISQTASTHRIKFHTSCPYPIHKKSIPKSRSSSEARHHPANQGRPDHHADNTLPQESITIVSPTEDMKY
ncbi:hypothetical protein TNCV_3644531 [Trichonephila clavipes]|nr:hypothetical protein TNCV_3644531 [Trichonephila clavipes]